MTDEKELAEEYADRTKIVDENTCVGEDCISLVQDFEGNVIDIHQRIETAFLAGYKAKTQWHKLDWKEDYPKVDRLVRVRTKSGEEYICNTYLYIPTEDEIGYGTCITQFEQLNGEWVDDTEIEYWCYIEPFNGVEEDDR